MTATETRPVTMRLMNSTWAWKRLGATNLVAVHAGHLGQPRPDPVSRTPPPVTMMKPSASSASSVIR